LTPQNLTNTDEFSELFFNKIDEIDNLIASKISLNDIAQRYNLKVKNSPEINIYGADLNGNKKDVLSNEILKEIFASEFVDQAQLTSGNNQFLIYEIISSENKLPTLNNEKVKKNLIKILTAKSVIEKNQEIQKNIIFKKTKQLRLEEMKKIAKDLNITINATSINNINDKNVFKEKGILSQIYSMNENDIAIVSSKDYKKNYLVFIKETINTKLEDGNNEYEKYLKISNSNLSNKILGTYDLYLNKKYKVDINQKALDKVKNMYR
jgi:peptidyl-prolyl cis-trans isomerase D